MFGCDINYVVSVLHSNDKSLVTLPKGIIEPICLLFLESKTDLHYSKAPTRRDEIARKEQ
jgi:hypothetical protein